MMALVQSVNFDVNSASSSTHSDEFPCPPAFYLLRNTFIDLR